jgi:hypothetical protein
MHPPDLRLLAGEVSGTSSRELPNCQWARRMVALTRDFHVFTSRVTTSFSAVFVSVGYIAKTWYVRALFGPLISHFEFILSNAIQLLELARF